MCVDIKMDNTLPPELVYQILVFAKYDDIKSYCATNRFANSIWYDDGFWIQKLDHELGYRGCEGYIFNPSYYIGRYQHPDMRGLDIYKRWTTQSLVSDLRVKMKNRYNDMIFWMMDRYNKYFTQDAYDVMVNYAAGFNNQEMMKWFEGRGAILDELGADEAAMNGLMY